MKALAIIAVALSLAACSQGPQIVADKGAVYGVVNADAHPAYKEKHLNASGSSGSLYGSGGDGGLVYQDNMVNYAHLDDLYVGIVLPSRPPQTHHLELDAGAPHPDALAVAPGDTVHVHNNSGRTQELYLVQVPGSGDGLQSIPAITAGAAADFTVTLTGELELLSETDEGLRVRVLSRPGLLAQRLQSGHSYQFEKLEPGAYPMVFWYWRLGKIEQTVQIQAGENLRVDKTMSVATVLRPQ